MGAAFAQISGVAKTYFKLWLAGVGAIWNLLKRLSIDLSPVANLHHKDTQSAVLYFANDATVAHPVAPKTSKRAGKCFASAARVILCGNAFIHVIDDAPRRLPVELPKLSLGRIGVINRPSQDLFSRR